MAEFISFQPSDFMNTLLYTGNGTAIGSGGNAVTGVGFAPDATWIKQFSASRIPAMWDTVRGVEQVLRPSSNAVDSTVGEGLTTFGADGFTLGDEESVNADTGGFVSWNWKCGTTSGIATDGNTTITPGSYSFNTTSGVSVVKYTGNSSSGAKVAHGCGKIPFMIWIKNLDATADWSVYHQGLDPTDPGDYSLVLNNTSARADNVALFNDTITDSVNFTLGDDAQVNSTGVDYIAYCFAQVPGFSKMGFYNGTGNADGHFQFCGFRPAFIFIKDIDNSSTHFYLLDDKRGTATVAAYNVSNNNYIQVADTAAQVVLDLIDFNSNGFKCRSNTSRINLNDTFIYSAFAQFPMVSSNDIPGVAR